jgi:hypothetical protein
MTITKTMRVSSSGLFGNDFYQDAQTIQISKASLGLQPREYSAEAILLAIVLRALMPFQGKVTGNGQTVTGNNGAVVTYNNGSFYERMNLFFWQRTFGNNNSGIPTEKRSYVLEIRAIYDFSNEEASTQIQPNDLET